MESSLNHIENRIYSIRGVQVMLDNDLAELYQTETKYINRAVHRNPGRFPLAFAYQLTQEEWAALRFQIGTLNEKAGRGQHRKYMPYVFTEQGVAMLREALRNVVTVKTGIRIVEMIPLARRHSYSLNIR
jgi:hypothetical protein